MEVEVQEKVTWRSYSKKKKKKVIPFVGVHYWISLFSIMHILEIQKQEIKEKAAC